MRYKKKKGRKNDICTVCFLDKAMKGRDAHVGRMGIDGERVRENEKFTE